MVKAAVEREGQKKKEDRERRMGGRGLARWCESEQR